MQQFKISENSVCKLLGIDIPIIQAGMVWTSGWQLASAVSSAGGLGTLGAGSMYPEQLREQVIALKAHCTKPFAVNVPLLYPDLQEHFNIIIDEKVPVVITSAGNPALHTHRLKQHGIKVIHVVSSVKFAVKSQGAGCDAVVAEGFEAGGHNGREETTSMVLIPAVADAVQIPVIAAGGIATGRQMLAAFALGASGVQVGSAFVVASESACHGNFKQAVINAKEGSTSLRMKSLTPVRLLDNPFSDQVAKLEKAGASVEVLEQLLGRGRAKAGMYSGDLENGELEIGQASMLINKTQPASAILTEIWQEFLNTKNLLQRI